MKQIVFLVYNALDDIGFQYRFLFELLVARCVNINSYIKAFNTHAFYRIIFIHVEWNHVK